MMFLGGVGFIEAQTAPAPATTTKKTKKAVVQTQTTTATSPTATGLKKDGTPDMRLKANRAKAQTTAPAAPTQPVPAAPSAPVPAVQQKHLPPAPPPAQPVQRQGFGKTQAADPVLETDAKGRTIYQGPRGGKYYINKNGHKEYVK